MSLVVSRHCFRQILKDHTCTNLLPAFLVPAFALTQGQQCFSTTAPARSRVGAEALSIPTGVSLRFIDLQGSNSVGRGRAKYAPVTAVEVSGPLGMRSFQKPRTDKPNTK